MVAPRVGAWIETIHTMRVGRDVESHPVWVRGLKHKILRAPGARLPVAPRVGAWIETASASSQPPAQRSHPVWVRGLKPQWAAQCL